MVAALAHNMTDGAVRGFARAFVLSDRDDEVCLVSAVCTDGFTNLDAFHTVEQKPIANDSHVHWND